MIKSVTLKNPWAERVGSKRQRSFEFAPGANILVGPNGCGKSSLMSAIMEHVRERDTENIVVDADDCEVRLFDFEKDNPRIRYLGNSIMRGLSLHFQSHGETIKEIISSLNRLSERSVTMLDEPDQALDFEGILSLINILKKTKAQVIIASHNPFLILHPEIRKVEFKKGYLKKVSLFAHKIFVLEKKS